MLFRSTLIAPQIKLTEIGKIAEKHIQKINSVYADVTVENYIIMPDHIHLLIFIDGFEDMTTIFVMAFMLVLMVMGMLVEMMVVGVAGAVLVGSGHVGLDAADPAGGA